MASIRMAVTSAYSVAYSVAMAVSTSVLAARLAGQAAASTPTAPSPARAPQQLPDRHGRVQQPGPQGGPLEHRAEQVAAADAEHAAGQGDQGRLDPDHRPQLAPGQAEGAQQPDLPGPFHHREGQGVDHAQDPDRHRQPEQGVQHREDQVGAAQLGLQVLRS
jgi:hypothetical protein